MSNLLDLKGRVALVTGGGQGVGRRVALDLAENGAGAVVVNDYFVARAQSVADEVRELGVSALAVQGDVTDGPGVAKMVSEVTTETGRIDIVVHNAGNAGPGQSVVDPVPFWETEAADWDRWLDVNLFGVLNVSRAVLPGMVERNYGRMVTVVSDAGRVGEPHLVVYSAAKAAAAGFTRALAKAAGRHGITANCVSLSAIRTPTTAGLMEDDVDVKAMFRNYVIRRPGEPEDASALITLLCSDSASWITGQTYPVNGGYSFAL